MVLAQASEVVYSARIRQIFGRKYNFPHKTRPCARNMKYFASLWTIKHRAGGDETNLYRNPVKGIWSEKAFIPLVYLLLEAFPGEMEEYLIGREIPPKYHDDCAWYAAHLIMNRVHKMYHETDKKTNKKRKCLSREHWSKWDVIPDISHVKHLI